MEELLQIGDVVQVRYGVQGIGIGVNPNGWVGRVTTFEEMPKRKRRVCVEWDSLTLNTLPYRYLRVCARLMHLDWDGACVPASRVKCVPERDTAADVKSIWNEVRWHSNLVAEFGRAGERIYRVIRGRTALDSAIAQAWWTHLVGQVRWPLDAIVSYLDGWDEPDHFSGYPFLHEGEDVKVLKLEKIDSALALITQVEYRSRALSLPLCNLSPAAFQRGGRTIEDYRIWFELR